MERQGAAAGALEGLEGVSLGGLAETVLPNRTSEYIGGLCGKLFGEGVTAPCDLLGTSKRALEAKLSTHAAFSFSEMADTLKLRDTIERVGKSQGRPAADAPSAEPPAAGRRRRSRSGGRRPPASGQRPGARPRRGGGGSAGGARLRAEAPRCGGRRPPEQSKPELWAAVERSDAPAVRRLLEEGREPEERYLGWTPLMKASEEGCREIVALLLERGVDLEAVNKRGRGALSFAAAPSMKRPSALEALRLLLERGADPLRKDAEGLTPRARAERERREDAVRVLEEFERERG